MIVQEFGGDINVNSTFGRGSEFFFTFMLDQLNEIDSSEITRIKSPN
jgi:signal transduction histidine kinase